MRKSFKVQAVLTAAAMAVSMSGAAFAAEEASSEEASSEAVSEQAEEESEAEISDTEYPLTLTGTDGEEVTIESEPEKIVSMGPNMTEILYAIGAGDKLAGRTDYCDYPSEVLDVPSVGTISDADIEAILALEPDLVLASTHFSDDSIAQLEKAGVPVLYLYDENDVNGVYDMIETIGQAVNCNAQAAQTVELMQGKLDYVADKLEGTEAQSVYYVVGYGEYGDYTAGGDTFINGILELAGGDNIASDVEGWSYSSETLLEKDPSNIIIPEYALGDFGTSEPYSELTAVKDGNVYAVDNNMLDRQGPRNADAVVTIAQILHPEAFPDATEYPLTVSDANGDKVVIEADPASVVALDEILADMAAELGEAAAVVYSDAEDADSIAALEPDLVLASSDISDDLKSALTDADITVLVLDTEADAAEEESIVEELGKVLDRNAQAEAYVYAAE